MYCTKCGQKLPEPETCPKNCRHLSDEDGCDFCHIPGSPECRRAREPAAIHAPAEPRGGGVE